MKLLSISPEFKALNVALHLDEGLAREDGDMTIYYGERHKIWTRVGYWCSECAFTTVT